MFSREPPSRAVATLALFPRLPTASGYTRTQEKTVNKEELAKIQAYLRKTFGNPKLEVRARAKKMDSAEVYLGEDFIAVLFREDEEGEVSYQFQMAILEMDLEGA